MPTERQREVLRIFDKMRRRKAPYDIQCGEITLTVLPNVYSPKYFTDSFWFAQELTKIVRDRSLLEIGVGTGIVSVFCARQGARVIATDDNADAVRNTRINATRHHVDIDVREGNVYHPLKVDEKFDFIFWNHPFNNWSAPVNDRLLRAGLDHNYEGLKEYIRGAKWHLLENGKLLLGTGDQADLATIGSVAGENGYSLNVLKEAELPLEDGGTTMNKYLIYEFVRD